MYETKRKKSFSLGKRAIFDRFMREKKERKKKSTQREFSTNKNNE